MNNVCNKTKGRSLNDLSRPDITFRTVLISHCLLRTF